MNAAFFIRVRGPINILYLRVSKTLFWLFLWIFGVDLLCVSETGGMGKADFIEWIKADFRE